MPLCVISNCLSKTGRKGQDPNIILYPFLKKIDNIKEWLLQTGTDFDNVNVLAMKILEENKTNKYRMCSLNFKTECYKITQSGKFLLPDAKPTVFDLPEDGDSLILDTLKKKKSKRKRPLESTSVETQKIILISLDHTYSVLETLDSGNQCSIATQTDFTLLNSTIIFRPDTEQLVDVCVCVCVCVDCPKSDSIGFNNQISNCMPANIYTSTPIKPTNEFSSPQKKRANLQILQVREETEWDDNIMDDIITLSLIEEQYKETVDFTTESILANEEQNHDSDLDYIPPDTCEDSEMVGFASIIYGEKDLVVQEYQSPSEEDQVNEKKLIIFESCLDHLLYMVKCQYSTECNYTVKSFSKIYTGSSCWITGKCYQGHKFFIMETQPKVGSFYSGNLLLAASILFSGQNFQKVNELFSILGLVTFSEKTFYCYQSNFLFPVIDLAWQEEKSKTRVQLQREPLCIAGDGQCDSPGHSAKYCIYTMIDTLTEKVIDFEIVQRSQCSLSVAMEKFAFEIVTDSMISNGFNIVIFASDRHVGIRKKNMHRLF
ncbi:uncharacterized protein LOC122935632 [Bufo gargarizans]|uniref:uncharacterized protein LOC122935632 n=1 Tax=Bufo gargarizans TaxID=30331 RepID=UPI001CF50568|nr:uncharacterized protein LOC122935632 [Bufo gargarizans]